MISLVVELRGKFYEGRINGDIDKKKKKGEARALRVNNERKKERRVALGLCASEYSATCLCPKML